MEPHPVLAEPLLRVVVGRCDVPVQGHAYVDDDAADLASFVSVRSYWRGPGDALGTSGDVSIAYQVHGNGRSTSVVPPAV